MKRAPLARIWPNTFRHEADACIGEAYTVHGCRLPCFWPWWTEASSYNSMTVHIYHSEGNEGLLREFRIGMVCPTVVVNEGNSRQVFRKTACSTLVHHRGCGQTLYLIRKPKTNYRAGLKCADVIMD